MSQDFFERGGEMGALMRKHRWETTPLGPPEGWPQPLRTAVRILLTTGHPMFIWWGPDLIQFYNDAYRATMGPERHPSALGQRGRDCWGEIWDIIGPQIEQVMAGKGATWHEDQLVPVTRHGRREDVWWTYSYGPIDDETAANGVGGVLVVCNDVTAHHMAREALRVNEERLELALSAGVVGTWDWWVPDDKLIANPAFARLNGIDVEAAATGVSIAHYYKSIHPADREQVRLAVLEAAKSGERLATDYRVETKDGGTRWLSLRGRCFHEAAGAPTRFLGVAIDNTERKRAEEHRTLLTDELNHRVKNLFSMMQAIVNQTMRSDLSIEDARERLSARIMAMSRAQDVLIGRRTVDAEIGTIVRNAVEPVAGGEDRYQIDGPTLHISPQAAFIFTLALHELSTNAAKYGALSNAGGSVNIAWRIERAKSGEARLLLEWTETGGPVVTAPTVGGFGSRLLESVLTSDLEARAEVDYRPTGVVWRIDAPLANTVDDLT
ncbi:MAG: HWE histidine kinase domain-containing protein [Alphaproteobacteria bacterium]